MQDIEKIIKMKNSGSYKKRVPNLKIEGVNELFKKTYDLYIKSGFDIPFIDTSKLSLNNPLSYLHAYRDRVDGNDSSLENKK